MNHRQSFTAPGPGLRPGNGTSRPGLADDISVVIPTLRWPIIERCLEAMGMGSALPREIIVVDQGDSDAIDDWLEPLSREGAVTRHLRMQGTGRAAAMNRGLEAVRTPFVLITDDDCEVDRDRLRAVQTPAPSQPQRLGVAL